MNLQRLGDIIIVSAQHKEIGIPELEEYMHHISEYVRCSVAIALGYFNNDQAYTLLEKLMEDPEEYVAGDAILSASKFGDICLPKLEEKYNKGTYQIKTRVINALGSIKSQKAKELMYQFKETEEHPKLKEILEGMLL